MLQHCPLVRTISASACIRHRIEAHRSGSRKIISVHKNSEMHPSYIIGMYGMNITHKG